MSNLLFQQNFEEAMKLPMPNKSFATLNIDGEFLSVTVRPGLINKHLTSEQLQVLAAVEQNGAVKYSASHGFIVSIPKNDLEETLQSLTKVGLYAIPSKPCAVVKCCDFCDGERLEALPIAEKLLRLVEQYPLEKRIRIGFNACTLACYNAVQDDLALIYYDGKFDVYAGAIQMGRRANSGQLLLKKIDEAQIISVVCTLLEKYKNADSEKFSSFIQQEQDLAQQILDNIE